MSMHFEELDEKTRQYMLDGFLEEEASGKPYRSAILSTVGLTIFPNLMLQAVETGTEVTLASSLTNVALWRPTNSRGARVNVRQSAEQLAITEFNTWYVRGLCKRLLSEGINRCQVYRAAMPRTDSRSECSCLEGQVFPVEIVLSGHRAKYWPIRNSGVLSIPYGPSCHHTIRRV